MHVLIVIFFLLVAACSDLGRPQADKEFNDSHIINRNEVFHDKLSEEAEGIDGYKKLQCIRHEPEESDKILLSCRLANDLNKAYKGSLSWSLETINSPGILSTETIYLNSNNFWNVNFVVHKGSDFLVSRFVKESYVSVISSNQEMIKDSVETTLENYQQAVGDDRTYIENLVGGLRLYMTFDQAVSNPRVVVRRNGEIDFDEALPHRVLEQLPHHYEIFYPCKTADHVEVRFSAETEDGRQLFLPGPTSEQFFPPYKVPEY